MEKYNWWTDPKNKEEVEKVSWWNHAENKDTFPFPVSVINSHDDVWVATCNSETEKLIGKELHGVAQGETKEDAVRKMFKMIQFAYEYSEKCRLSYQRFVPFRKGDWKYSGGKWFAIFGIQFYFRYGRKMKGGWFIPFTKQNISISNDWKIYNNWKKSKLQSKN